MESGSKNVIRVGSRKSELALIQTNYVIDLLKKVHPEKEFSIVTMETLGDRILDVSLPKIGEKALFTKDLEDALRSDTVDFVVHSLKDMPTTLPDGLAIGAVFERDDPRDALILREDLKEHTLDTLPAGSVIGLRDVSTNCIPIFLQVSYNWTGTSSLRRTAQLHASHPLLVVDNVRGNLNTRFRKLDVAGSAYSALILAHAGLQRMGWHERVTKVLNCSEMLYAVGQGALAVECRADNVPVLAMLAPFNHAETYCRIMAERSFLKTLGGGCSAPVGVSTKLKPVDSQFKLTITGAVWSLDGTTRLDHTLDQKFDQIKKTQKHKLSPTEDNDNKKLKTDERSLNPIEVLNNRISEKTDNLNCEDDELRNSEDLVSLKDDKRIFCGLIINTNIPIDVIMKCDNLGRDLADALIGKGALDVMKISQDYIRNSMVDKKT